MEPAVRKLSAVDAEEGTGVRVKRLFPGPDMRHLDPFVLMDEFFVTPPGGFPSHAHRGFEAITYLFEGTFRHQDNLGHDTEVARGGAQRFTAGRGLEHGETAGGELLSHGIQLWINLAPEDKETVPSYQQVEPAGIPEEDIQGARVRTIVGPGSALAVHTPMVYKCIDVYMRRTYQASVSADYQGFVYVTEGELQVAGHSLESAQAVTFAGLDSVDVEAIADTRFILVAGRPHGAPIRQRGSYVD